MCSAGCQPVDSEPEMVGYFYDASEADGQLHGMKLVLKKGLVVIEGGRLAGHFPVYHSDGMGSARCSRG